jgi:hypothetical protein
VFTCTRCRATVVEGMRFCSQCGLDLATENAVVWVRPAMAPPPTPVPPAPVEPTRTPTPVPTVIPRSESVAALRLPPAEAVTALRLPRPQTDRARPRRWGLAAIVGLVALMFIVALGVGGRRPSVEGATTPIAGTTPGARIVTTPRAPTVDTRCAGVTIWGCTAHEQVAASTSCSDLQSWFDAADAQRGVLLGHFGSDDPDYRYAYDVMMQAWDRMGSLRCHYMP